MNASPAPRPPLHGVTLTAALALGPIALLATGAARLDLVTGVMLALVGGLGAVIVRFSRSMLRGSPGAGRYAGALLATLAAVSTLVTANHLAVLAAAWTATSLALHQLLTFFEDRPEALLAAHKKFLTSRLADAFLWAAIALIASVTGTLDLDALDRWAAAHATLPPALHLAAALLVVAAALKSAQLPFHGWLTQVMEAPTPVSALLHAGVVNLGGFLMIRLAPLMARAPLAQLLLVAIGTATAVIAALVMRTRVSVKVALAWSTCAQMGFMLVECGLGLWHLALLHLVAHSLYKAHAFLSAGGAVDAWRVRSLTAPSPRSLATVVAATRRAVVVAALFALTHLAAARLHLVPAFATPSIAAWSVAAAGVVALVAVRGWLVARPTSPLAETLHAWLFAGLYLDERFTRWAFRVWPPRLPPVAHGPLPLRDACEESAR